MTTTSPATESTVSITDQGLAQHQHDGQPPVGPVRPARWCENSGVLSRGAGNVGIDDGVDVLVDVEGEAGLVGGERFERLEL